MIGIAGFTTLVSALLLILVIYRKDLVKSVYFPLLLFAVFLSELGNLVEMAGTTAEAVNMGLKIRMLGVPFIPTFWFLCILEFCGLKFKRGYAFMLLMIVPTLLAWQAVFWESHRLFIADVIFFEGGRPGNPTLVRGPLFFLREVYQYGIDVVGVCVLAWRFRMGTPRFKKQIQLFVVSALIPFSNTLTYIVPIGGFNVDVTHYILVFFMALFTVCLYHFGVINRMSIIRDNALHQVNEGVLLFDHERIYMDANRTAKRIFPELRVVALGTCASQMDYLPFSSLLTEDDGESGGAKAGGEFSHERSGFVETFAVSVARLKFRRRLIGYSVILNNISLLKRTMDELEEKSSRDPLTKLYNRGYLFETGERWFDRYRRSGDAFGAILFDIDHFKRVNDTYGHPFGDYVLKEMARICSAELREADVLGRYGGEEFCLLLPNTSREGALAKAEYLRKRIAGHTFRSGDVRMSITASFGVVSCDSRLQDEEFTGLIKRADDNLYRAKESGRNCVC